MFGKRLIGRALTVSPCQLRNRVQTRSQNQYSFEKAFCTKPKSTSTPPTLKPGGVQSESSSGGGGLGKFLLFAALVAPPGYVAYKLNFDQQDAEFKKLINENAPFIIDILGPKAEVVSKDEKDSDFESRMKWLDIKDEIESLASRLEKAEKEQKSEAAFSTRFTKEEVAQTQGKIDSVKKGNESESTEQKEIPKYAKLEQKPLSPSEKIRESIDDIRGQVRQIKAEADSATERKLSNLENELRSDLEVVLAKDVATDDIEALRKRVVQLVLELKDRHRWEALRLHELTKAHTEELVNKYSRLLQDQGDTYEKLIKKEAEKSVKEAISNERTLAAEKSAHMLEEVENKWKQRVEMELQHQNGILGKKMDQIIREEKKKIEENAAQERKHRLEKLQMLQKNIDHLEGILNRRAMSDNFSSTVHNISVAMFDLIERISDNRPLGSEINALKVAANDDPVISKALESFPERLTTVGIPTTQELEQRFETVYESCQKIALVPDQSGGMLEHALASIVAALSLNENVKISELKQKDDPEAVLARAKYYLEHDHNLEATVKEFDNLSYPIKETAADWLVVAKDRIQAEQILKFIRAHVASLALDAQNQHK